MGCLHVLAIGGAADGGDVHSGGIRHFLHRQRLNPRRTMTEEIFLTLDYRLSDIEEGAATQFHRVDQGASTLDTGLDVLLDLRLQLRLLQHGGTGRRDAQVGQTITGETGDKLFTDLIDGDLRHDAVVTAIGEGGSGGRVELTDDITRFLNFFHGDAEFFRHLWQGIGEQIIETLLDDAVLGTANDTVQLQQQAIGEIHGTDPRGIEATHHFEGTGQYRLRLVGAASKIGHIADEPAAVIEIGADDFTRLTQSRIEFEHL